MTRKTKWMTVSAVISMCICAPALAVVPHIHGTVYNDFNWNNSIDAGEGFFGATVRLYQDDGDGILEPGTDDMPLGSEVSTNLDGSYSFMNVEPGFNYFVERQAQTIGDQNVASEFSPLINFTDPSLIIDSFTTPSSVSANPMTPVSTASLMIPTGEVLGNERDLFVRWGSGLGDAKLRVNPFGQEILQYDTTSGVKAMAVVTWDGTDRSAKMAPSLGLDDLDLTDGGAHEGILLKVGVDRTGKDEKATFRIFEGNSDNFSEASIELPITDGSATAFTILPFSDFQGLVNPNKVDAIQLILGDGNSSIDAQLDFIGVIGSQSHDFVLIPEPATGMLALIGMIGLGLQIRRRR